MKKGIEGHWLALIGLIILALVVAAFIIGGGGGLVLEVSENTNQGVSNLLTTILGN